MFKKNANIIKIQTKFLRKLCDSQAGKVMKAMMVWKTLPQLKDNELVAKAAKFENNLARFGTKIVKSSF